MSQNYETRLNGNWREFVAYAKKEGVARAMEWYGFKDYASTLRYLKEKEPDYDFQYSPPDLSLHQDPDTFAEAILRQFAKQEAKYKAIEDKLAIVQKENAELKEIIKKMEKRQREISRPVMEKLLKICESE